MYFEDPQLHRTASDSAVLCLQLGEPERRGLHGATAQAEGDGRASHPAEAIALERSDPLRQGQEHAAAVLLQLGQL